MVFTLSSQSKGWGFKASSKVQVDITIIYYTVINAWLK